MTDRPEKAKWLTEEERSWLIAELAIDHEKRKNVEHLGFWQAISNPKVLFLSAIYFIYQVGNLGIGLWMPQIIQSFGQQLSHFQIGLVAMVPYAVATLIMVLWSKNSDRSGERQMHTAVPLLIGGLALAATGLTHNAYISVALISIALAGIYAFKSPFWSLPGLFLSRSTAAVSIAAINAIGNLGGFVGPYAMGAAKTWTGSALGGLVFLAVLLILSFFMTWFMRLPTTDREDGPSGQFHAGRRTATRKA